MLRHLWANLTTIPTAPPPVRPRWHALTWSILAAGIAVLYAVTYTNAYLAGSTNSHPLAVVLYNARAALIVGIAVWTAAGVSWRPTTVPEQRQVRIMASIYVVLIALTAIVVWLDPPRKSPAVVVYSYYATIALLFAQGHFMARRGHITASGVILIASALVEIMGSLGIANTQRAIAVPLLYVLVILVAGLLVRWWSGLVLAVALPLLQSLLQTAGVAVGDPNWTMALTQVVLLGAVGGLVAFYARSIETALQIADAREKAATARAEAAIAAFEAYLASREGLAAPSSVFPEAAAALPHTQSTSETPPDPSEDSA